MILQELSKITMYSPVTATILGVPMMILRRSLTMLRRPGKRRRDYQGGEQAIWEMKEDEEYEELLRACKEAKAHNENRMRITVSWREGVAGRNWKEVAERAEREDRRDAIRFDLRKKRK